MVRYTCRKLESLIYLPQFGGILAKSFLVAVSTILVAVIANAQSAPTQHTVDPELRLVVEEFVKAVDHGDTAAVAATYSPDFLNVRVADDGGFVRLSGPQILAMLKPPGAGSAPGTQAIPTRETVIQHAEVIGEMGFVLMTRVKNLGSGWEALYYSLVWHKRDSRWELLREFVHQRSSPKHF